MSPAAILPAHALPGLGAAVLGLLASRDGIADGGLWSALVAVLAALWLALPLGTGAVAQAARLGLAFLTRLSGALLVAALAGAGRPDLIVTLIACLLAAMAIEMVQLLRAQEPSRA